MAAVANPKARVPALDLLRGAAVAGMILVNSPGSWTHVYRQLDHAPWHGWTLADMVFPSFLFAVGMALGLSFPHAWANAGDRRAVWGKVARRTAALIALGLVLNAFPLFQLGTLRIPGILQRIGLCYLLAAILAFGTARRDGAGRAWLNLPVIGGAIVALLAGYWALLVLVPVPGFGAGRLDPAGNIAGFVDRAIFTVPHLWSLGKDAAGAVVYDPEGLLSTLPATANVLFGLLAAAVLRRTPDRAILFIALAGALLLAAGLVLDPLLPINKRIWTSSFALVSTGFSALLLSLLALVPNTAGAQRLTAPLRILGGNAIVAFVISQLFDHLGAWPLSHVDGHPVGLQHYGFAAAQAIIPDPYLASFACAVGILALVTLIVAPLHRRDLHLRL